MGRIRKIDIHAHALAYPDSYPASPRTGLKILSAEELFVFYDKLGIEIGVLQTLVSPEAALSPITSESCKALADLFPQRLMWFCGVDPRALSNINESDLSYLLKHYKALGAKGLGEINANMNMDNPMIDNLFSHCESCDMPVLFHMGRKIGGAYGLVDEPGLPKLEKMLQRHPNLQVIGHSVPFWAEFFGAKPGGGSAEGRIGKLMRRYNNLYCDLSAGSGCRAMVNDPEYTVAFLTEFQDRVLYGCDIVSNKDEHPFILSNFLDSMFEEGKINAKIYRKILRENAEKLLGIED